jgi:hypothetical protein
MFSHTVPQKLLEQFAYDDPRTKSKRLWQYQKSLPPWWKGSPKTATAWDSHFADPANAAKEEQLELRLKQEFEDPVNDFIEDRVSDVLPKPDAHPLADRLCKDAVHPICCAKSGEYRKREDQDGRVPVLREGTIKSCRNSQRDTRWKQSGSGFPLRRWSPRNK